MHFNIKLFFSVFEKINLVLANFKVNKKKHFALNMTHR